MGSLQLVLISAVTQSRIMSHRQKLHSLANGLFTWTVYYLSNNKKQNFGRKFSIVQLVQLERFRRTRWKFSDVSALFNYIPTKIT